MSDPDYPGATAEVPLAPVAALGVSSTTSCSSPLPRLLLTATEAAARLGIGRSTLWRLHARGLVPAPVRLGAAARWSVAALEEWIAAGCPTRDTARPNRR